MKKQFFSFCGFPSFPSSSLRFFWRSNVSGEGIILRHPGKGEGKGGGEGEPKVNCSFPLLSSLGHSTPSFGEIEEEKGGENIREITVGSTPFLGGNEEEQREVFFHVFPCQLQLHFFTQVSPVKVL